MLVFVSGKVGRCLLSWWTHWFRNQLLFLSMHNAVLDWPLWFLNTWWQCDVAFMSKSTWLTEPTSFNVMAAFAENFVGRWWILSGISSKAENFLRTAPRLQAVDLHWLWAHVFASGGGSENLQNGTRQSILHCLPNWAVLCRQRSCCFHETCQFWSAPTETLSRVFRFYLALSGMPAHSCNHVLDSSVAPKIIYWTAYGCINFCNLVASNCTRQSYSSQVLFSNYAVTVLATTALSRGFLIIDKLFITFGGSTVISALIVW